MQEMATLLAKAPMNPEMPAASRLAKEIYYQVKNVCSDGYLCVGAPKFLHARNTFCMSVCTHVCACVRVRMRIYVGACMHVCMRACVCTHVCACM